MKRFWQELSDAALMVFCILFAFLLTASQYFCIIHIISNNAMTKRAKIDRFREQSAGARLCRSFFKAVASEQECRKRK